MSIRIIKLNQQCIIETRGEFGWEPKTVYEPTYLVSGHVESLTSCGNTVIRMVSGEKVIVKENIEEVCELLGYPIFGEGD